MFVTLLRALCLFVTVSAVLRFMGKRQIGELQPSELATTIMISNIAAIPIENPGFPLLYCLVAISILACFEVISSTIAMKFPIFRRVAMGNPRAVIRNGKLLEKEMQSLRLTLDDLLAMLRSNQVFDLREVGLAIVETNGNLSVYPKFAARPVTHQDLDMPEQGVDIPPSLIIADGKLDPNALATCNHDAAWVERILKDKKLSVSDVFLLYCDHGSDYYLVPKEGKN